MNTSSSQCPRNRHYIALMVVLTAVCGFVYAWAIFIETRYADRFPYVFCVAYSCFLALGVTLTYKAIKGFIRTHSLFFHFGLVVLLFNASHFILYALRIIPIDEVFVGSYTAHIHFSNLEVVQTGALVTLAILSYYLGGMLVCRPSRSQGGAVGRAVAEDPATLFVIKWFGFALLAVTLPAAAVKLWQSAVAIGQGGYAGLYGNYEIQSPIRVLSEFFAPACVYVIAYAISTKNYSLRFVMTSCLVLYSVSLLVCGWRGEFVASLLPLVIIWDRYVGPISMRTVLIGVLVLLVVFPALVVARRSTERDPSTFYRAFRHSIREENPFVASMKEIGSSSRCIALTLRLVPNDREHDFGAGYVFACGTIVPNLFWDDAHPLSQKAQHGAWLTRAIVPEVRREGGGLGFSCIAEAYLAFSWFAPAFFLLIGLLFGKISKISSNSDAVGPTLIEALILGSACMWARQEVLRFVRPFFFAAVVPSLAAYLLRKLRESRQNLLPLHSSDAGER